MYSPAALPSSMRAAPAKKRSWSAPTLTSSSAIMDFGWPVLRHSASTSSSQCSSRASASFSSAVWRSLGVVLPQVRNARCAAATAASTSAAVDTGIEPTRDSSTGSISGRDSVAVEGTNAPSM